MREAAGRSWRHLADERIEGAEPASRWASASGLLRRDRARGRESCSWTRTLRRLATSLRSRDDERRYG